MKKILDNKFVGILFSIIKIIVWIFILCILAVVLIQRIFDNKVSIGNYRMFTVVTGSMKPEYDIYDVVIVKNTDLKDIKVGDDVTYEGAKGSFDGKIVTHRVILLETLFEYINQAKVLAIKAIIRKNKVLFLILFFNLLIVSFFINFFFLIFNMI